MQVRIVEIKALEIPLLEMRKIYFSLSRVDFDASEFSTALLRFGHIFGCCRRHSFQVSVW